MTTCCSILGLVFLVITNLAIIISFATPYWIEYRHQRNQGLWAFCAEDSCTWVFEDDYSKFTTVKVTEAWWISVQALTCFGLSLGLFSMLLATIALCCECKACNASCAIAGLLIMAFLSLGVAAVDFGICANKYLKVDLEVSSPNGRRFGWSFWLDCASACLALLTSFIYMIAGRGKYA